MPSYLKLLPLILLPISLLISSGAADFIITFSVIFFLFYSIKSKDFNWIKDKYFILLLIFYIYLLVNFYFSQFREVSLSRAFGFIRFPLFIMSVKYFFLKDFSKINIVIKSWVVIIIIVLIDTFVQYHYGKNILGYPALIIGDQIRLSSFLDKEYKIGGFLYIFSFTIFSYLVFKIFNKNLLNKFLALFFYFLSLIAVYLTGERSNFIIFCLSSIFFIFFLDFKTNYKIFLLLISLIILLFLFKFDPKLKIRFVDDTKNIIYSKNFGIKESILQSQYGAHYITAYQIFRDYPFFGSGIKTYRIVCEDKKYENYNIPWIKNRCSTHPHSTILEFLSELGIIGTVIFLIFFFYLLYKSVICFLNKKNTFLLGLIICTAFFYFPLLPRGSFFTNWNAILFWNVISLLICYTNINNKIKKK
jgi:O-antigen ligase